MNPIYDQVSNPRLKRHIGLLVDRRSFLGMFEIHAVPAGQNEKVRRIGFADRFFICRGCPQPHPVLDEIGPYVRIRNIIVAVFWPSWIPFI